MHRTKPTLTKHQAGSQNRNDILTDLLYHSHNIAFIKLITFLLSDNLSRESVLGENMRR